MTLYQPGILAGVPPVARYLTFRLLPGSDVPQALGALSELIADSDTVTGMGPALVSALGHQIEGLREPPNLSGNGLSLPVTPAALWCWLRGDDPGEVLLRSREVAQAVAAAFAPVDITGAFTYGGGRDLTGYEDGTENPTGQDAERAALVENAVQGVTGSSFVAVQKWVHDLARFDSFSQDDRDRIIGRRLSDNEELDGAPPSAHVKRTAQENFEPEAFVLRRSMPWADVIAHGLMFVAFGYSFDAFEAQLQRMMGLEDGITDALFRFTRPVSTSYFWCPPLAEGRLDLTALGL